MQWVGDGERETGKPRETQASSWVPTGPSSAADRATHDNNQSLLFWLLSAGIESPHLISSPHLNSEA